MCKVKLPFVQIYDLLSGNEDKQNVQKKCKHVQMYQHTYMNSAHIHTLIYTGVQKQKISTDNF